MAQFSIHTTFHKWLQVEGIENAIYIIGNVAAGKTTICHLLRKHINKIEDVKFQMTDGKYLYDGQINPKNLKPITIYPKVFSINQGKQKLNVVEVPSRIYQPEAKKRPNLDRFLNFGGLIHSCKHVGLVFVIQAKYTSNKIDVWKKSFRDIFDYFNVQSLDQKVFESSMFLISKADNPKQIIKNRFQLLIKNIEVEQKVLGRKDKYLELVKFIQNSPNNFSIFSKPNKQNRQELENEVKQIFSNFQSLKKIQFDQQILEKSQKINLIESQMTFLNQYNEQFEKIMYVFRNLIETIIFKNGYKNLDKYLDNDFIVQLQKAQSEIFKSGEQQKWNISVIDNQFKIYLNQSSNGENRNKCKNIVQIIFLQMQLKQELIIKTEQTCDSIEIFMHILSRFGLIRQKLKIIFSYLIEFKLFQERFSSKIQNLNYKNIMSNVFKDLFTAENEKRLKQIFLDSQIQKNQSPEYYQKILDLINSLFSERRDLEQQTIQKIEFIEIKIKILLFNIDNFQQKFSNFWKIKHSSIFTLNNTKSEQLLNLFMKRLLQILEHLKYHEQTIIIYQNMGLLSSAKQKYQFLLTSKNQNMYELSKKYIQILIKMHLYEKALEKSYEFIEVFEQHSIQILQKMKEIEVNRTKSTQFQINFAKRFDKKTSHTFKDYLSQDLILKINEIVKNFDQLKDIMF